MPLLPAVSWSSRSPQGLSACVEACGAAWPSLTSQISCPYFLLEACPAPKNRLKMIICMLHNSHKKNCETVLDILLKEKKIDCNFNSFPLITLT